MNTEEDWSWLFINALPGVGPSQFQKLKSIFPSAEVLKQSSFEQLKESGLSSHACEVLTSVDRRKVAEEKTIKAKRWFDQSDDHHIIMFDSSLYPRYLNFASHCPPFLFVKGDPEVLSSPQIAMVGTRKPSASGKETAFAMAQELAALQWTITSGMAIGIDGLCHQGALTQGQTIAVLGCGVDVIYPQRHQALYHQIVEQGAVISEQYPGTAPDKRLFPRRNRLISGLAQGVVVVEAAFKSGSLITAQYAAEQGRDVFAVPDSIYNPQSQGAHRLIKQGAYLVESGKEVSDHLRGGCQWLNPPVERDIKSGTGAGNSTGTGNAGYQSDIFSGLADNSPTEEGPEQLEHKLVPTSPPEPSSFELTEQEQKVFEHLDAQSVSVDLLVVRTHMAVHEVLSALLTLEIKGGVKHDSEGYRKVFS